MKNNLVRLRQEAMDFIHDNISNLDIREKQLLFVNCSMLYDKSFVDLIKYMCDSVELIGLNNFE